MSIICDDSQLVFSFSVSSDVWKQWPELTNDNHLRIPTQLSLVEKQIFSSVLRVSSKDLWVFLHYDVCDNILIGVRGRKRVVS
jgi:hypothetical protein